MCSEFYTGWHTRWGEPLSQSDPTVVAAGLERILATNASLSLYVRPPDTLSTGGEANKVLAMRHCKNAT